MNNDNDTKCQILSDDSLYEKNQILDKLRSQFSQYSEDNQGCGYTQTNEWNPFIHTPTLDTSYVYKNKQPDLYNRILDATSGKISDVEIFEIKDWDNPHRILHPIDLPCFALKYTGKSIPSSSNIIILGEITGFVYKKQLQSTTKYFNLKLINEENPKYILDVTKSSNLFRYISNASLGPLFSYKKQSPNVKLHTIYIDNWPHIIVTTIPGVELSQGSHLVADFSSLQPDVPSQIGIQNVYNGLALKNDEKIIPVLGIALGTPVKTTINNTEVIGKVTDFVEQNNEKLFLVNYPNGDYELYTRMALMIKLLKEYLRDSKLDQLLVPLHTYDKHVGKSHDYSKVKKIKRDDHMRSKYIDKSHSYLPLASKKAIDKKSKSKKFDRFNSTPEIKTPYKSKDMYISTIPRTLSNDSNVSIVTRSRRSFSTDKSFDSIENKTPIPNNKIISTKSKGELPNSKDKPVTNSVKPDKKKKVETNKIFEKVSFRRNSPQEVKEKVPISTLKDYCIDTLLELSRIRKNWRDSDNRKQFNFHFAKISNAKAIEDLEPQFTMVFYKLYQYVDLTIASDKVTFDAVGSCEKENPQLIDHLLELLTNIYSEND